MGSVSACETKTTGTVVCTGRLVPVVVRSETGTSGPGFQEFKETKRHRTTYIEVNTLCVFAAPLPALHTAVAHTRGDYDISLHVRYLRYKVAAVADFVWRPSVEHPTASLTQREHFFSPGRKSSGELSKFSEF